MCSPRRAVARTWYCTLYFFIILQELSLNHTLIIYKSRKPYHPFVYIWFVWLLSGTTYRWPLLWIMRSSRRAVARTCECAPYFFFFFFLFNNYWLFFLKYWQTYLLFLIKNNEIILFFSLNKSIFYSFFTLFWSKKLHQNLIGPDERAHNFFIYFCFFFFFFSLKNHLFYQLFRQKLTIKTTFFHYFIIFFFFFLCFFLIKKQVWSA